MDNHSQEVVRVRVNGSGVHLLGAILPHFPSRLPFDYHGKEKGDGTPIPLPCSWPPGKVIYQGKREFPVIKAQKSKPSGTCFTFISFLPWFFLSCRVGLCSSILNGFLLFSRPSEVLDSSDRCGLGNALFDFIDLTVHKAG
jgi:hypothetical protein